MLGSVALSACRRHGSQRGLLLLLPGRLSPASLVTRSVRAYATDHAHHEARIENIRNIGIIAHVDAVRPAFPFSRGEYGE